MRPEVPRKRKLLVAIGHGLLKKFLGCVLRTAGSSYRNRKQERERKREAIKPVKTINVMVLWLFFVYYRNNCAV